MSSTECYDENYSIIAPYVYQRLDFIREHYSDQLLEIIEIMLNFNIDSRPTPQNLWEIL